MPVSAAIVGNYVVTVGYDGTAHGTANACSIATAPIDASANDNVVCTNDNVQYLWSYSVPFAVTATVVSLSQTVPSGVRWDSTNVTLCSTGSGYTGTGAITVNVDGSQTLACTLTFAPGFSSSGNLPMTAIVTGSTANGTVLQPPLITSQAGETDVSSLPAIITVRSQPGVDLVKGIAIQGSALRGGVLGYVAVVSYYGLQTTSPNPKGIASLASPVTFTDDLTEMTPNTVLAGFGLGGQSPCGAGSSQYGTTGIGTGVTPGTLTCSQPGGAGTTIMLSLADADTSGYAPLGYTSPQPAGATTVFAGGFTVFIPFTDVPVGIAGLDVRNQYRDFAPLSTSGQANFGGTPEPGGAAGDTCISPTSNNNCAAVHVVVLGGAGGPGRADKFLTDPTSCFGPLASQCYQLPGANGYNEAGVASPGSPMTTLLAIEAPAGLQTVTDFIVCDKFNPAQQQVDTTRSTLLYRNVSNAAAPSSYEVQYTNRVYSYDAASSAADPNSSQNGGCGLPGDDVTDGPWFDSVALAGGAAAVSGVRVVDLDSPFMAPDVFTVTIPHVNVSTINGDHPVDWFSMRYDGQAGGSAASESAVARRNGYNVLVHYAGLVKTTVPAGQTSAVAGSAVNYQLAPKLTTSSTIAVPEPETVTVVDELPFCLINPQPTVATLASWTVTTVAGDAGVDGVMCTADDVSKTSVVYESRVPYSAGQAIPTINYSVIVPSYAPDGTSATNTAIVGTPLTELYEPVAVRTATQTIVLRAAHDINIVKTVDQPVVEIQPDHIGWTVTWSNNSSTSAANTQWIDVLPYNGDGRDTNFTGTLNPVAVTPVGSASVGTLFEYSSRAPASIVRDPNDASNGVGGATKWCAAAQFATVGCPAAFTGVTAIRVTIASFAAAAIGGMHIEAAPLGNTEGDIYDNNVGVGQSPALTLPVPESNPAQVTVVSSEFGDTVWWDYDADGVQDGGEPGIAGVTVDILNSGGTVIESVVTDANGVYAPKFYHSGTYRTVVRAATLPGGAVAVFDLDDGLVAPDGDSGPIALGIDAVRLDLDFGYQPVPVVATQVSNRTPAVGAVITDSIAIVGTGGAAGTLDWVLLGPVLPLVGSCALVDWSIAPIAATGTIPVTGDGTVTTAGYTTTGGGCYTYTVEVNGAFYAGPAGHGPGLVAESFLADLGPIALAFTGINAVAAVVLALLNLLAGAALLVWRAVRAPRQGALRSA